jgi:O-antigen/teichoic acid export membrane protein
MPFAVHHVGKDPAMLGRSVTLNVLGSATGLAVGFVASLVLGRWLGPSDRGLLGVMTAYSGVGVGLLGVGMPMAVMYYASVRDARGGALLGNSLLWGAILAATVMPLTWVLYRPLADALGHGDGSRVAWVLAAALVPLTFVDWTTHNQLLGRLRFGLYNVLVVCSKVATLALVLALVVVFHFGLAGALLATAAGSVIMIVGSLPPLVRESRPTLDRALLKRTIAYGSRVQVGTIFQLLNYRLDVLILQAFAPLRVVGYYVVAQIIAELSTTVASSFGTSVLPLVAHATDDEQRSVTTVDSLRHHGIVAAAAILANVPFGAAVIWWGYGSQYHAAVVPMLILLPAMWFLGTSQVVTGDLRGRGRPGLSSLLAGLTAIVTVALDLALIPRFGANGAAVASAVAYTVFGLASLATIGRLTGRSVRSLVIPSRRDLAAYPAAARALLARL